MIFKVNGIILRKEKSRGLYKILSIFFDYLLDYINNKVLVFYKHTCKNLYRN